MEHLCGKVLLVETMFGTKLVSDQTSQIIHVNALDKIAMQAPI